MGMRDKFAISPKLANEGIWLDFGDFRVRIGRAGEGNTKFKAAAEAIQKQHGRALSSGMMSDAKGLDIMYGTYANSIVLDWNVAAATPHVEGAFEDTDAGGWWIKGIEGPDGGIIPATPENYIATFKELPDLFLTIKKDAESIANFRQALVADQVKN